MRFLINIAIVPLICFSTLLFVIILFGAAEYRTSCMSDKQRVEKRCQLLLAIRLHQVTPRQFVENPNSLMNSSGWQKGLLGYTIGELIQQHEAGKSPKIYDFNVFEARQRMQDGYSVY
jgi:hypothetical protein